MPVKKKTSTDKEAPKGKAIKKDYDSLFTDILIEVAEQGKSVISAIRGKMSTQKFFELLEDEDRAKRYARACEMRAEVIANEIIDISDNAGGVVDNAIVQRDRLRVDSRKWILAKLHPKKYGEKIDMTSDNKPINPSVQIEIINSSSQVKKDDSGS